MPDKMSDLARQDSYSEGDDDRRRFADALANMPSSPVLASPFEAAAARTQAKYANRNQATVGPGLQHLAEWAFTPAAVMQSAKPTVPGQWSEEDQFRQDMQQQAARDWGVKTGFTTVLDPAPALMTMAAGLPLRGAAALGAGAGQRPPPPANQNIQSVDSLADAVRRRLVDNPAAAEMAAEPFLRPLDKARLAATQAQSDRSMQEALFKLGPNPTREEFEKWVRRPHMGALARQDKYK